MSTNSALLATESAETERRATPHTAVIIPSYRKDTGLRSGLIAPKDALFLAHYSGTIFTGMTCRGTMQLGRETPFYEVAFRGKVYRMLTRPIDGQPDRMRSDDVKFELVRTAAPGLRSDGVYLATPTAVPNTPRTLVAELQTILDASLQDILENAYSIFHYRLDNRAQYPETMTPAGYTLREVLLGSVDEEGHLRTLYETPKGTNVELWTLFLRALDRHSARLASYAQSSMALKEFGEAGYAAIREALRIRALAAGSAAPMAWTRFLEAFPPSADSAPLPSRDVGRNANLL